jgi:putative molybdopterin biosynthesis protein
MSLVKADGIVTIPRFSEGHHAGETVTVEPAAVAAHHRPHDRRHRQPRHDARLALRLLRRRHPLLRLASSHVGSVSGLLALQRNEAHLAGSHLLDEETGEYNVGYIQRMLAARASTACCSVFSTARRG